MNVREKEDLERECGRREAKVGGENIEDGWGGRERSKVRVKEGKENEGGGHGRERWAGRV